MNKTVSRETRRIVARRAGFVCEYCLIFEGDAYYRFQIERIISRKHGGRSQLENLAYSCSFCNLHKGSDIGSIYQNVNFVRFYNPRSDRWNHHFRLNDVIIEPLTEIGEVTSRILQFSHDQQIVLRQVLINQARYPSDQAILISTEH